MKILVAPYLLKFKFDAGTSRGILKTRKIWIVKLESHGFYGFGEVSPLRGLSTEGYEYFDKKLEEELQLFKELQIDDLSNHQHLFSSSTLFGLESALLNLKNKNNAQIFDNSFYLGKDEIQINGLVWMGDIAFMKEQIQNKLNNGFSCIKMKIGAIDFNEEYKILQNLRKEFPENKLTLRVDANGAFNFSEAKVVLDRLHELNIHSIEQPILAWQIDEMEKLCRYTTKVGIALDEELIGIREPNKMADLLDHIKPQYIVLKPTLHGGILGTKKWITLAKQRGIGWWVTSALESNIGLNAICQLTKEYELNTPQGLGTGSLYTNNIPSPLEINKESISYNINKKWDYSPLDFLEI